jgi:hypothetical protein
VSFQPAKAIFVSVDVLLAVRIFFTFIIWIIVIKSCRITNRPPLELVQAMTPSSISSNASGISSDVFISIQKRSHWSLQCQTFLLR